MASFLANENVPLAAIQAIRLAGHDLASVSETAPGMSDQQVLARALAEGRVLLTFDKDFGELAFRLGQKSSCGVILLRPKLQTPDYISRFLVGVLGQAIAWENHFSVAEEGHLRVVPLP